MNVVRRRLVHERRSPERRRHGHVAQALHRRGGSAQITADYGDVKDWDRGASDAGWGAVDPTKFTATCPARVFAKAGEMIFIGGEVYRAIGSIAPSLVCPE